jgi:hypothetical protein
MNVYSSRRTDRAEQLKAQIRRERLFLLVAIAVLAIWLMAERMSNRFCAIQVNAKTVVWARSSAKATEICDLVKKKVVGSAPVSLARFREKVTFKSGRFTGNELLPPAKAAEELSKVVSLAVKGWVIEVDGKKVVGLPTKEKAEETLAATLDQFRPRAGTPEGEPRFEGKVKAVEGEVPGDAFYDSAFAAREALLGGNDRSRQYTVARGDTLASIAEKNKISVALLRKLNSEVPESGSVGVGQRLFVKRPKPAVTVVSKAVEIEHAKPGEAGVTGELPLKRVLVTYNNGEVVKRETIE